MAYVTVPKDLDKVKNKVVFNLTLRQVVCLAAAVAVGAPAYFLTRDAVGTSNAATAMALLMLPAFFFALYEKDGLPLEKILGNVIRVKLLRPAERRKLAKKPEKKLEHTSMPKAEASRRKATKIQEQEDKVLSDKKQTMVMSLEPMASDRNVDEVPIKEEFILKELSDTLNRSSDGETVFEADIPASGNGNYMKENRLSHSSDAEATGNGKTAVPILEMDEPEEEKSYIQYEPLTSHEAYLDRLLETLKEGEKKSAEESEA